MECGCEFIDGTVVSMCSEHLIDMHKDDMVSEVKQFLEHMAFEYGTSEMSVFDTKTWAEYVLIIFNQLISNRDLLRNTVSTNSE